MEYQDVYSEHAITSWKVSSLSRPVIPTSFKQTTIVPMPKKGKVTCLNDYHPVALTSIAMKYFERLVMAHTSTIIPDSLDTLQFAYRPNRSRDDTISIALYTALTHLDKRKTYVKNAVHRLQLSIQHHIPLQANHPGPWD
jgi:hypothetical protein